MTYDKWKSSDPRDGEPEPPRRLPCGCWGVCDPYAHDTAPDWDGTPDGPDWNDLSPDEQSARYQDWERNR
jgi:hypothetical protein